MPHALIVFRDEKIRDFSFDEASSHSRTYYPLLADPKPQMGFVDGTRFIFVMEDGTMKSLEIGSDTAVPYHPENPPIQMDGFRKLAKIGQKVWFAGKYSSGKPLVTNFNQVSWKCNPFLDPVARETAVWSLATETWSEGPTLEEYHGTYLIYMAPMDDEERGLFCGGYYWMPGDGTGGISFVSIANLTDNTWTHLPQMAEYRAAAMCGFVKRNGKE